MKIYIIAITHSRMHASPFGELIFQRKMTRNANRSTWKTLKMKTQTKMSAICL